VNAAFLLVTTALLAGADGQPPAKPAPAPAAVASGGCNSCNSCNDCNDCGGHKWRDKMRGWFHRDCDECNTCGGCEHKACGCEHHAHHAPKACDTCAPKACNTCNTCGDACNDCGGHKWRDKMRGWFHRGCDDCNTCSDCCGGAPAHGGQAPEPLKKAPTPSEPPKQMPKTTQIILTPEPVARTGGLIVE
jgi:hypothetical protein